MGLLTQLATCKLYGPVRNLVLRANGGGEYTDKPEVKLNSVSYSWNVVFKLLVFEFDVFFFVGLHTTS